MKFFLYSAAFLILPVISAGQIISTTKESTIITSDFYKILLSKKSGTIDYNFSDGSFINNTVAVVKTIGAILITAMTLKCMTL
ncbi:hypothetical protein [Niabella ginsengisoli]|uniref:Uncharacterized protein n=1 Tax=Niabella ginsengisoli TaxID=522298 RepID=A0ABS9SL58_9BACT|nr:hypothetical protein [Niabella ginsengisoli]MCH5599122.1 hypothetical protein [Niabella ginsengisoli]